MQEISQYFRTCTKTTWVGHDDATEIYAGMLEEELPEVVGVSKLLILIFNADLGQFWCPCGKRAPKDGNIRCSWCKRRHNLATWKNGYASDIPFFDNVSLRLRAYILVDT